MKTVLSLILSFFLLFTYPLTITATAQAGHGGYVIESHAIVGSLNEIEFFPHGDRIALAANPLPEILNLSTMKIEYTLIGQNGMITSIDVSDDFILTGSKDGSLFVWDIKGNKKMEKQFNDEIIRARISPQQDTIAILLTDRLVVQSFPEFNDAWEYSTEGFNEQPKSFLEWNPNGSMISLNEGFSKTKITLLDKTTGKLVYRLELNDLSEFFDISWNYNGVSLAAISRSTHDERRMVIWNYSTKKITNNLYGISENSLSLCWVTSNDLVANVDYSVDTGYVRIWQSTSNEYQRIELPDQQLSMIACNPKGSDLVVYSKKSETLYHLIWVDTITIERPFILIDAPLPGISVSGSVEVMGYSWGNRPIEEVRVRIGNGSWFRAEGTARWHIELDISDREPGFYTITAISCDMMNCSVPDDVTVFVSKKTRDYIMDIQFDFPKEYAELTGNVPVGGRYYNEKHPQPVKIQLLLNATGWTEILPETLWGIYWNTSVETNGERTIYARAFDGEHWTNTISRSVNIRNEEVPTINSSVELYIDSPPTGSEVNGTILITGRTIVKNSGIGNLSVNLKFNQENNWRATKGNLSWNYSLDTLLYPNGPFLITCRVDNGFNFSRNVEHLIFIKNSGPHQNLPPIVSINNPMDQAVLRELKTVSGTAKDDVGVLQVMISIDHSNWAHLDGMDNWTFIYSKEPLSKGKHTIDVKAFDGTLYSNISTVTFIIDPASENNTTHPPDPTDYRTYIAQILPVIIIFAIISALVFISIWLRIKNRPKPRTNKRNENKKSQRKKR